jgi:hypothetical protein
MLEDYETRLTEARELIDEADCALGDGKGVEFSVTDALQAEVIKRGKALSNRAG